MCELTDKFYSFPREKSWKTIKKVYFNKPTGFAAPVLWSKYTAPRSWGVNSSNKRYKGGGELVKKLPNVLYVTYGGYLTSKVATFFSNMLPMQNSYFEVLQQEVFVWLYFLCAWTFIIYYGSNFLPVSKKVIFCVYQKSDFLTKL